MDEKKFVSRNAGKPVYVESGYWAFIPNQLPPVLTWSTEMISRLAEAERGLGELSSLVEMSPFTKLLSQSFIRNEAVISSRIEGTRSSLTDLYSYEINQLSFLEQADDVREVQNYIKAMNYGLDRLKSLPMSMRLIKEMHAQLMSNVRGGKLSPGEFRKTQNWIGPMGSTPVTAPFVPPPVAEMHQALDDLEKFIHANSDIPAIVRAGLIHYQFEAIHPFLDGNGRMGRLLTDMLFYQWGYLAHPVLNLSVYFERYRFQYYDYLLTISQEGKWEEWLGFFLRGVAEQSKRALYSIKRLQEIRQNYQVFVDQDRNAERMAVIIDYLFTRPLFSAKQLSTEIGIPFKTAVDYLIKLEKQGLVREITGYARNRIYQADEVLQAVKEIGENE
jgi:Fic family protein